MIAAALTIEQQLLDRALADEPALQWRNVESILPAARASYFVLHRSPIADPLTGVTDEFLQLVNSLGVDARQVRREYVGRVRGTIDWAATIRARSADQQNPLRFVCREAERETNTPQNQLLVFVLVRLAEALQQIPASLRDGQTRTGITTSGVSFNSIGAQADLMATAIRPLRVHPRLRVVTTPTMIEQHHLDAAHHMRHPGYDIATALYERWYGLIGRPTLAALHDCARHSLLLPSAGHADTDLWLDLAALQLRARPS